MSLISPDPAAAAAPPAPTPSTLDTLLDAETSAVTARRRAAHALADDDDAPALHLPRVGLALSGGGIRSATYCLGLLRGLAQRGLLARLDYLSTVSGGGYAGAMFGRLVMLLGIRGAEEALKAGDSMLLAWLRRNGRYLTPAGSRDLGMAIATYLRAWLAIEIEFGAVCLALGVWVVAPHAAQQSLNMVAPTPWEPWITPWWPVALGLWLLLAPGTMAGYWLAREPTVGERTRVDRGDVIVFAVLLAMALGALALAWAGAVPWPLTEGPSVRFGMLLAICSVVLGEAFCLWRLAAGADAAALRNLLTRALRGATLIALGVFIVGLVDALSWQALLWARSGGDVVWGGASIGAAVVALRTFIEPLQKRAAQNNGGSSGTAWHQRLLNLLGQASVILLGVVWITVIQWAIFDLDTPPFWHALGSIARVLMVFAIGAAWLLLTMAHTDMPNASSLHGFYRARLTRAYLSVGNPARFGGATDAVAQTITPDRLAAVHGVTDVVPGDDAPLAGYQPESRGGPLHIVNCCLNQTRDDASGLYNADRKGLMMSVSARGCELGPGRWVPGAPAGSLGRWVAISGAAAAPGSGANTTRGFALLLYFLGVRLGFWFPSLDTLSVAPWRWKVSAKLCMLTGEALAYFRGVIAPWWYLSDGGHFDNTGVYALIKRRLDFIILADCGADPDYQFADIENLVRKARIDFSAQIEFYTRADAARLFDNQPGALEVLSPNQMADHTSGRGVMLARIRYVDGTEGSLLVLKPALHTQLDVDLLAYARRKPDFPQQATSDQFFDEAQWESYHRLGEDLALSLNVEWLSRVPGWDTPAQHDMVSQAVLGKTDAPASTDAADDPLAWRRSARAAAVGASLGLGAAGTVLLGAWQAVDQWRQAHNAEQQAARTVFDNASKEFSSFNAACTRVPEYVMAHISELDELTQGRSLQPLDRANAGRLLDRVRLQCQKAESPQPDPSCKVPPSADDLQANLEGLCAGLRHDQNSGGALSYWRPVSPADTLVAQTVATAAAAAPVALPPPPAPAPVPVEAGRPAEPPPVVVGSGASPAPAPSSVPTPGEAPGSADKIAQGASQANVPGASTPSPGRTTVPQPVPLPATMAPVLSPLATMCGSRSERVWVYTQVYDEASRARAEQWRSQLGDISRRRLLMAPIEDVTRTAELRQQRQPVPWRVPTLIVQDPGDKACATVLAAAITAGLKRLDPAADAVAVRDLPASLNGRKRIIELWWPPAAADAGSP